MAGAVLLLCQVSVRAATFQDIYDFNGTSSDGQNPTTGLTVDSVGRLVGVTPAGGIASAGVAYRLTPPSTAGAVWAEEILYNFAKAGHGTRIPEGPVVLQGDGTIVGTAAGGAMHSGGIVYRLDNSPRQWTFSVLHSFGGHIDPTVGLIAGPSGLLYGTTLTIAVFGHGTIFGISPAGDQAAFDSLPSKGEASLATAVGADSLVYALGSGGAFGYGSIVGAQQTRFGFWKSSTLYNFGPSDAGYPSIVSPLINGPNGVLYGCAGDGARDQGAVYRLTPPATRGATWTETILYNFRGQPDASGYGGQCFLTLEPNGSIFGVATAGGVNDEGALFSLTPPTQDGGKWKENVLYSFDGGLSAPQGMAVRIGATYYGVAQSGGVTGTSGISAGGVWSYTP